TRVYMMIRE
ncbi:putative fused mannose-specific PTS enzymes: IIA component/IIB component, partial [Serratia symbiotica str. Tucson]